MNTLLNNLKSASEITNLNPEKNGGSVFKTLDDLKTFISWCKEMNIVKCRIGDIEVFFNPLITQAAKKIPEPKEPNKKKKKDWYEKNYGYEEDALFGSVD